MRLTQQRLQFFSQALAQDQFHRNLFGRCLAQLKESPSHGKDLRSVQLFRHIGQFIEFMSRPLAVPIKVSCNIGADQALICKKQIVFQSRRDGARLSEFIQLLSPRVSLSDIEDISNFRLPQILEMAAILTEEFQAVAINKLGPFSLFTFSGSDLSLIQEQQQIARNSKVFPYIGIDYLDSILQQKLQDLILSRSIRQVRSFLLPLQPPAQLTPASLIFQKLGGESLQLKGANQFQLGRDFDQAALERVLESGVGVHWQIVRV